MRGGRARETAPLPPRRVRCPDAVLVVGEIAEGECLMRVGNELVGVNRSYVHTQGAAAATWTITHGLGRYPSVMVVDSAGTVVHGGIAYNSIDELVVTFSAAFSGKAFLN